MKKFKIIIALFFVVKLNYTQAQNLLVGLQACYPLDNSAVNNASTGSSLDGTPFNVNGTIDRFGNANAAYAFSGSGSSYIKLPNDGRIKPNIISFSAWVNFVDVTNPQVIVFTKNNCGAYFEGYELAATKIGTDFNISLVKSGNGCSLGTQQILTGATNILANTWYHVGFYIGADSLKLFVNGVPDVVPVTSLVSFDYSSADVILGGTATAPNYPLNGAMDAVRFYNRKLSNTEFFEIYNSVPICSYSLLDGLQACYPLNCDIVNYAPTALVPPSLDGASSGGVFCSTGHTGAPNTAYKFAGTPSSYIKLPSDPRLKPTNGISFSAWSRLDANNAAAQYIVFAKNTCPSYFEGYALVAIKSGSQIKYSVVKSNSAIAGCGTQGILTSTNLYNPFTWHHIVFYIDNAFIKLYVDGVLDNVMASPIQINYDASDVILGGTNQWFNYPLYGSLDNVRFYDRELTAQEINVLNYLDPSCDANWERCYNYKTYMEYLAYCHNPNKTTGLSDASSSNNTIELYPNPSSGKVYLRNTKNSSILIYDVNGKIIQHNINKLDETTAEIDLTNNANGIYLVKVLDANGISIQTTKIIISH